MRVHCACPTRYATDTLLKRLSSLGIEPIVTPQVIQAVYEGTDKSIGETLVEMFLHEADHVITVQYADKGQGDSATTRRRKTSCGLHNL